jgi:uncharacterized protein (DUF302 family)
MNPNGVVTRQSPYPVNETIDRLQNFLQQHGATIYARIDQQAEVQNAGLSLLPLQFIMFGNPKAGGPIMTQKPIAALDLPSRSSPGRTPETRYGWPITMPNTLKPVTAWCIMKPRL